MHKDDLALAARAVDRLAARLTGARAPRDAFRIASGSGHSTSATAVHP